MTGQPPPERKPLLRGRGLVRVQEFAAYAGLDEDAVRALVEAGRVEGVVDEAGRRFGLFDDVLPSGEELVALGLRPGPGYRPEDLASYVDEGEDEDDGPEGGPTSVMSW